jgi:uncharacterized damage-inducible protein DinB
MTPRELLIDTFTHIPPRRALEQLTTDEAEKKTAGTSHSIAEIVAHMSFWQDWFCDRCDGVARPMVTSAAAGWPGVAPGSWPELSTRFSAGLERAVALAQRGEAPIAPAIEFGPLAHYTVRDAIVHIAQHNSHHLGQVIVMRQLLGQWPPPGGGWTW